MPEESNDRNKKKRFSMKKFWKNLAIGLGISVFAFVVIVALSVARASSKPKAPEIKVWTNEYGNPKPPNYGAPYKTSIKGIQKIINELNKFK